MTSIVEERVVAMPNVAAATLPLTRPVAAMRNEFLSFRPGYQGYGIDILQEIRSYEAPSRIANVPHFIKGAVNLRRVIVPIVDLRLRLACEADEYTEFTVVTLLNVGKREIGAVVVDLVSDVCWPSALGREPGSPELPAMRVLH